MGQAFKILPRVLAWFFLLVDVAALLFCCTWAFHASTREGEQAYAIVFLIIAALFVTAGGSTFFFGLRRGSARWQGVAAGILGLPTVIALALWLG
jgi:uncharacterized membrane protein